MAAATTLPRPTVTRLVDNLRARFGGELIAPLDPGYDAARAVYNGAIDRRPALIARCTNAADVAMIVGAARENGVTLAVRGGGHNAGGLGVADDALVVDLGPLCAVRVDPVTRRVRVGGGATWAQVDRATHVHGLAVPGGVVSSTGVGGLTLGGGLGYLSRAHGLSIDALRSARVVLADGCVVTASRERHPDLFWALRGGGGNFGVVIEFEFEAHPVRNVVCGPMLWPLDRAAEVLRGWDAIIASAPRELYGFFVFMTVPPGDPFPAELHLQQMCGVVWCYSGAPEDADAALAPARALRPVLDGVGPAPLPELQGAFDELYPAGLHWHWRADFVDELSDEAIALHVEHARRLPSMLSSVHLYPIDGAVHDVASDATAFAYRGSRYAQVVVGVDPELANLERITTWTREYHDALHPHSAGGAYVNMLMHDEGQDRVHASYGANHARLVAVKRRYDPANLFAVNQNIEP